MLRAKRKVPGGRLRFRADALELTANDRLRAPNTPATQEALQPAVREIFDISRFTIRTVPRRLSRMAEDPMLPLLADRPDLSAALTRLHERLAASKA